MKTNTNRAPFPADENLSPKDFFSANGYYVARGLVEKGLCDSLIRNFESEVKRFSGELLRSTTASQQTHQFSESGFMTNPILNVHNLDQSVFPEYISSALNILSSQKLGSMVLGLMGETPVLVQSVYYECSMGTPPHEDSHYFDSEDERMFGCWIALENIHEDAGRFCIYPESHLLGGGGNSFPKEAVEAYKSYERLSLKVIRQYDKGQKAPSLADFKQRQKLIMKALKKSLIKPLLPELHTGDAIFFSSRMLHSSKMPAPSTKNSRSTLIGHFVPGSKRFIRYRKHEEALRPYSVNGLLIQADDQ